MGIKKLPIIYRAYGSIIRNIFDFRWKSRFTNPLLEFIQKINKNNKYYCYIKYVDGIRIRLDLRDWIPQLMFVWGDYVVERNITVYFRQLLKPGMVFVDIGANIGYYSLMASKIVGSNGKVFSFEPWSRNRAILEENIKLNSFSNISIIPKAVSNEENYSVKIYLPKDNMCGMGSLQKLNDENYTDEFELTPTTTFQSFLNTYKPGRVDVIKIDVEGSELNVLKGMSNSLEDKNFNPIILVELAKSSLAKFSATIRDVIDSLTNYGFKAYKIDQSSKLSAKSDYEEETICVFLRSI
jgi:FkbM family methyltransferase